MSVAAKYPHLTRDRQKGWVIEGHKRISVRHLAAEHRYYGWSAEALHENHPQLLPAAIYSALAYYYDHRDELDLEMDAADREIQKYRNKTVQPARSELLARLRSRKK